LYFGAAISAWPRKIHGLPAKRIRRKTNRPYFPSDGTSVASFHASGDGKANGAVQPMPVRSEGEKAMKWYGIALALTACVLLSWTCGASEPSQPSRQSLAPTAKVALSGALASRAVAAAITPASKTLASNPTFSAYQDCAVCRDMCATSAATYTFENLLPPRNNGLPVEGSASDGLGVPIDLGKNWTVRPAISFGTSSESGEPAKPLSKATFSLSLSWSF
jgi:hypothetical protein